MSDSLQHARMKLEPLRGGTVPVDYAIELIDAAIAEIRQAHGEVTLRQAVLRSRRSRSWFERRLPRWQSEGLARKPGRDWLISVSVLPERSERAAGFDEALNNDDILAQIREREQRSA